MRESIRSRLSAYAEEEYRDFSSGLIPGAAKPLLGVRLPQLRRIAKEIVKNKDGAADWREETRHYDGEYEDLYFEETMLRGMVIGYGTSQKGISCEEGLVCLEGFIPHIENWSVCDSFCNSFAFANRYREEVWAFLQPYLYSDREYEVRVALILLLSQYLKYDADNKKQPSNKGISMAELEENPSNRERSLCTFRQYPYLEKILATLGRAFTQGYYAQMAAAWLLAETFVSFPYETNQMLAGDYRMDMDQWTYNKALQKIRESLKPDKEVKEYVKKLKK